MGPASFIGYSEHTCIYLYVFILVRYFGAYKFGEPFSVSLVGKLMMHAVFFWAATCISAGLPMSSKKTAIFVGWRRYTAENGEPMEIQRKTIVE